MKHLAKIQNEFLKQAAVWDDLSIDAQREYLKRHPKSKRRVTGKADMEVWGRDKGMLRFITDGDARKAVDVLKSKGIDVERKPNDSKKLKFVNDFERRKALDLIYNTNLYKMLA